MYDKVYTSVYIVNVNVVTFIERKHIRITDVLGNNNNK